MQAGSAKKITVLTIGTVFIVGVGKSLIVDERFPPPKFFFATGFTAFGLAAATDIEPQVAGPLSLLILTVVGIEQGTPLIEEVMNRRFGGRAESQLRGIAGDAGQSGTDSFNIEGLPQNPVSASGGARAIVEQAAAIATQLGGYVVSDYRAGDYTSSGSPSDHSSNDASRAARDIAVQGVDALQGPPHPNLDKGVVAIGRLFGRNYGDGKKTIIDTFNWRGYRIQIIWRTPLYGGHMGHIHIGARAL